MFKLLLKIAIGIIQVPLTLLYFVLNIIGSVFTGVGWILGVIVLIATGVCWMFGQFNNIYQPVINICIAVGLIYIPQIVNNLFGDVLIRIKKKIYYLA